MYGSSMIVEYGSSGSSVVIVGVSSIRPTGAGGESGRYIGVLMPELTVALEGDGQLSGSAWGDTDTPSHTQHWYTSYGVTMVTHSNDSIRHNIGLTRTA